MQSLNIGKRVIKSAAGTAEHMYLTAAAAERKPDGCEHVGIILFHRQPHRIHSLRALGGIVIADINIRRDTERIEIFVSAVRCNNKTVRSKRADLRHTGIVARAENKTAGGIIFIHIDLPFLFRSGMCGELCSSSPSAYFTTKSAACEPLCAKSGARPHM